MMVNKKDKKISMKYTFPRGHFGKLIMRLFRNSEEKVHNFE